MGILGIENRTENWKTAQSFAPYFNDGAARLELAIRLGAPKESSQEDVRIELFWPGIRDHLYWETKYKGGRNEDHFPKLCNLYGCMFPDLRKKIETFRSGNQHLNLPQKWNYNPSLDSGSIVRLGNNLVNTEIDIVLETPGCLFIGEAKYESDFGTDGGDVLVHQLVRQYVMAWILVAERGCNKKVIPFTVGGNQNQLQARFMKNQGWLNPKNILSWDCIEKLARPC